VAQGVDPEFKPQCHKKKKEKKTNRAGGMAQVVEHLPGKPEALNSNSRNTPHPLQKKKEEEKRKEEKKINVSKYSGERKSLLYHTLGGSIN
jgi:hypothetical protein